MAGGHPLINANVNAKINLGGDYVIKRRAFAAARLQRPDPEALGFFVRVGRNDHLELLHLVATGERNVSGFVIDAHNIDRHHEFITEVTRYDIDVILDPKTQQMGFPGVHSKRLAGLPWGLERHHNISDFDGSVGQKRASQIAEAAINGGFTHVGAYSRSKRS